MLPTSRAINLAYDGEYLYTGGHVGEPIYRVRAEPPGTPEVLFSGPDRLLSLHVVGGRLYWSSYAEPLLFSAPLTGGAISTSPLPLGTGDFLIETDTIVSIGYAATPSAVRRSLRSSGSVTPLGTIPHPYGSAVLRNSVGDLLFGTQGNEIVWRIVATGGPVEEAFRLGGARGAQQIATDGRYLYATSPTTQEILRIDPGDRSVSVVVRGMNQPWGLVVTDTLIFYTTYFGHDLWAVRK